MRQADKGAVRMLQRRLLQTLERISNRRKRLALLQRDLDTVAARLAGRYVNSGTTNNAATNGSNGGGGARGGQSGGARSDSPGRFNRALASICFQTFTFVFTPSFSFLSLSL
jgi:hypothetical protein